MKIEEDKFFEEALAEMKVVSHEVFSRLYAVATGTNFNESEGLGECAEIYEAALMATSGGDAEPFIKLMTETDDVLEKYMACKSFQAFICIMYAITTIPGLADGLVRVCASNRVLERIGCHIRLSLG